MIQGECEPQTGTESPGHAEADAVLGHVDKIGSRGLGGRGLAALRRPDQ